MLKSPLRRRVPGIAIGAVLALWASVLTGGVHASAGTGAPHHPLAKPADAPAPLSAARAAARARSTGKPVIASALTTPRSETTAEPDGSFRLTQSAEPVRAWRHGTWLPLNATLQATGKTVTPAVTSSPLTLSAGGTTTPLATLTAAGRTLSLSWPGITLPTPTLSGATATYPDVLPGVDMVITADTQGGFSEVLVVENATAAANPALASLTFGASAPGLQVMADASGDLSVAASAKAEPVFTAPAPLMWDSAPAPTTTATVTGPDGTAVEAGSGLPASSSTAGPGAGAHTATVPVTVSGQSITLTPPTASLTGSSVEYPVYIDPTWHSIHSNVSDWTQVDSQWPDQTYWNESDNLQVGLCDWLGQCGYDNAGDPVTFRARSFIRMPVPSLPTNAEINDAYFYTTNHWAPSCTATPDQLWTTGGISSSTDWNNQPAWQSEIQQKSFAYGYSSSCAWQNGDVVWTITSVMKTDVANSVSNQTFGLRAASESDDSQWKQFRHGTGYENTEITVYYNDPPNKPVTRATSGGSCQYTASRATLIGNDDVTLSAYVSDDDGDNGLTTRFIVLDSDGNTVYDSQQQGTSVPTGNKTNAPLPLSRQVVQGWGQDGSDTAYTYHWYAITTDDNLLTSPVPADDCYFTYNPQGPPSPVISPDTLSGPDGQAVSASFAPAVSTCGQPTTAPCPASYTYQIGAATPVTVTADASGNWAGTIPLHRIGPALLTVYATDTSGNLSPTATVSVTGTAPATPYTDGDITGDGQPDLLTAGTGTTPGLWLSDGAGPGTLHQPVNIGGAGTGISPGADGPGDWAGAQVLHGDFTGDGVQDVMAYYPSGSHAGAAQIIGGTGDGSMLQPYSGNLWSIAAGMLTDPFFANPSDSPADLVAAGNASELSAGADDLIGILGDPASGYELDLYSIAGLSGSNVTGGYGYDTTLSTQTPNGGTDWNNYTLATAQPGGNPAATVLFALDTATGALWESTNPTASQTALIGTPGTWTQLTVPWGTTPPTLASADINTSGQTELWLTSGSTATAYTLSGTSLSQEATGTLTLPSHEWPLAEGNGATAADTTGNSPATLTGTPSWTDPDSGDTFAPALVLDGTSNALTTTGPAINTAQSFTVSAWVKLNPAAGSDAPATHNQAAAAQDGTQDSGFYLGYNYASEGDWSFYFANSDTTNPAFTGAYGPVASAGIWTHLVGVYNATTATATLYIDGTQAATTTLTSPWNATGAFTIGRSHYNGAATDYLDGTIANVQTWPTALTASQIADT